MNITKYIFILLAAITFNACEDVVQVDVDPAGSAVVIDAWINNTPGKQYIRLSQTLSYFDETLVPVIKNAEVQVLRNDGKIWDYVHEYDGNYYHTMTVEDIGEVGQEYSLKVTVENKTYTASTILNRVPSIDSIGFILRENDLRGPDGYYANFYARDPAGLGDTYWIKTYVNGEYLAKGTEINIAYDAGFDGGSGIDGLIFIPPVREAINRVDNDGAGIPLVSNDSIRVEIHSISNDAFNFLEILRDQINNGQNGIFALPLTNTRTNIIASENSKVVGFFNVANISSIEKVLQ